MIGNFGAETGMSARTRVAMQTCKRSGSTFPSWSTRWCFC
jgi:hypothetical protein